MLVRNAGPVCGSTRFKNNVHPYGHTHNATQTQSLSSVQQRSGTVDKDPTLKLDDGHPLGRE